ncbi:MAG TPA: hypothetical protein VIU93_03270 [Gallionellaceae bacterium]
MTRTHQGAVAILCGCLLFSAPTVCSAEENKPDATGKIGAPAQGADDKAGERKPADEQKKKSASDDEPGCNN